MLKGIIPEKTINRKKTGFTPPLDSWVVKEEYFKELSEALEQYYNKRILSNEWYNFYKYRVFKRNDLISRNYKIRLFLFYRWYSYWNKN